MVPADGWAWCWLGKACEAMGELEEARSTYEKAIELDGDKTDAPELLVSLLDRSFRGESVASQAPGGRPQGTSEFKFVGEPPELREGVEIVLEDGVCRGDLVIFENLEPGKDVIRKAGPDDEGTVHYVHPESTQEELTFVRTNARHLAALREVATALGALRRETVSGVGFFHRDADLEDEVLEKYRTGMMIQERAYVDCSYLDGGLAAHHRYLIITDQAKDLHALAGMDRRYGPTIIERDSFFKVLDVYEIHGHAQITLLHISALVDPLPAHEVMEWEKKVVDAARANFEENLTKPVVPALTEVEWLERTAFPLGMSEEGELFFGIGQEEPR